MRHLTADQGADLAEWSVPDLARRVEQARSGLSRIRYGSVFEVGVATVVLNPDSPLVGDNLAYGLTGTPAAAEATLAVLADVFADAGRWEAAVLGSPSSLPELGMVAEEAGYEAVDEGLEMVLTDPASLVAHEPGGLVRPVRADDEWRLGSLLADALDLPRGAEELLGNVLGHRLDDPGVNAFGVYSGETRDAGAGLTGAGLTGAGLAGMALGFTDRDVGLVAEVAVAPSRRRRGHGRALASAVASSLLAGGARLVVAASPTGGHVERFWGGLGFTPAYETSLYARRVTAGGQVRHSAHFTSGVADAFDDTLARHTQRGDHG